MEELDKIENYEAYWDLVNAIDSLCCKAFESDCLFGDDVISAIDRVKTNWIIEHTKANMIREMEEEETEEAEETEEKEESNE